MRLPSSGNWKVERGIVKITKIRNTNLAISLAWMSWKKAMMHPTLGLNLRKHFNLACQYFFVLIKRKLFSFLRKQRLNTKNKEVVFVQFPSFSTHCFAQFNLSTAYMYRTKTWRVYVIEMRTNDSQKVNIIWIFLDGNSLSHFFFFFFWNNPFYYIRDDSYCQIKCKQEFNFACILHNKTQKKCLSRWPGVESYLNVRFSFNFSKISSLVPFYHNL